MKLETRIVGTLAGLAAAIGIGGGALAQQVTGTPGSPSATSTIPGNQLPPPPSKFGGVRARPTCC
jgi:hypothetical protein